MNLQIYKEWLVLNSNKSNTAEHYYNQIAKFVDEVSLPITQDKLNQYFINLQTNYSKAKFNAFLNAFKKYLIFTKETFELPKQKKTDKRINTYFKKEEFEKDIIPYLGSIVQNFEKIELILRLLFMTGIRKEELLNLKRQDIDFDKCIFLLTDTKRQKNRQVIFPKNLKNNLINLFDSESEENNAFNITEGQLTYLFSQLNQQLNFRLPLSCRLFRHSCACNWLRQGLDLLKVKQLLGHSELQTTEIYAEPDFADILESYHKVMK